MHPAGDGAGDRGLVGAGVAELVQLAGVGAAGGEVVDNGSFNDLLEVDDGHAGGGQPVGGAVDGGRPAGEAGAGPADEDGAGGGGLAGEAAATELLDDAEIDCGPHGWILWKAASYHKNLSQNGLPFFSDIFVSFTT